MIALVSIIGQGPVFLKPNCAAQLCRAGRGRSGRIGSTGSRAAVPFLMQVIQAVLIMLFESGVPEGE